MLVVFDDFTFLFLPAFWRPKKSKNDSISKHVLLSGTLFLTIHAFRQIIFHLKVYIYGILYILFLLAQNS